MLRLTRTASKTLSLPECLMEFCTVHDSNFWVCGRNPMMWPFKWKLSAFTYTRCYLFFKILQNEIWKFGRNLPLATFGSERVNRNKLLKKESYCNFRLTVLWGAHNPGIINKLKLNTRNKALLFKTFWLSALRSVLTEAISVWTGLYYSWIPALWIAWILRKVLLFCGTYLYS